MFWRVMRRMVFANRGRLLVILLALGAGSAVTAALLNLQMDAKRRIRSELRAFGANVIVSARGEGDRTIAESLLDGTPNQADGRPVPRAAFLYATGQVTVYSDESLMQKRLGSGSAILTGSRYRAEALSDVLPYQVIKGKNAMILDADACEVGESLARRFNMHFGALVEFEINGKQGSCLVSEIRSFGGSEDNQIFLPLEDIQQRLDLSKRVNVIEMSVAGTPQEVMQYVAALQKRFPDVDVRPIRQFTEGEARLYGKISGVLTATVVVVLVLTALCVMAAMTNIAAERKNDVGLMKAIGGSVRRVLRIFLAEAALLGLAGGLIGAAAGILFSIGLGKAVFGAAAEPRLVVYPVSVGLTVIVAILAAYPLRRLANIRPASVFRGEE
jgi:putative ABC transport system permease protein